MIDPIDRVLDRLEGVQKKGEGHTARCPAHDDRNPSLSIGEGAGGRVLLTCHAGCNTEEIVGALGLTMRDLFPKGVDTSWSPFGDEARKAATYTYEGEDGDVRFEVVRFELADPAHPAYPDKTFIQRVPGKGWGRKKHGVKPTLYRLPKVIEAASEGRVVILTEGEKDVHTLEERGFTATCNPQGAGKWRGAYSRHLKGAHVVILPDNDGPGREHAEDVARSAYPHAASVRVVDLPDLAEKGDVTDWFAAGHAAGELKQIIQQAEPWAPDAESETEEQPEPFGVLASDVEAEPVAWTWKQRVVLGGLNILDGDPGLGKSTLVIDLAARVTTGRPMPQGAPPVEAVEGGVVLVTTEDSPGHTIRPRLEAAGADLRRVLIVPTVPDEEGEPRPLVLPEDVDKLQSAIRRVDARLVVIDPLMAHLGGSVNAHRDSDVRRALAPLSRLAHEERASVVVIRHLNKSGGTAAIYRGGGSIGIIGAARVGLLLGRHPEDEDVRVLAPIKNNLSPFPASLAFRLKQAPDHGVARIDWQGAVDLSADDLLRGGDGRGHPDEKQRAARDFLRSVLADGPRLARELYDEAEAEGIPKRTLQRAKKALSVESYRDEFQGPWKWRLSNGRQDATSGNSGDLRENTDENTPENGSKSPFNGAEPKDAKRNRGRSEKSPKAATEKGSKSPFAADHPKDAKNTVNQNGETWLRPGADAIHHLTGRRVRVTDVRRRVATVEPLEEDASETGPFTVGRGDLRPLDT